MKKDYLNRSSVINDRESCVEQVKIFLEFLWKDDWEAVEQNKEDNLMVKKAITFCFVPSCLSLRIWKDKWITSLTLSEICEDRCKLVQTVTPKYFTNLALGTGTASTAECSLGIGKQESAN